MKKPSPCVKFSLLILFISFSAFAATLTVQGGNSIGDSITAAKPGDTIEVWPGTYREVLIIDKPNITLRGHIENGEWPVLDGERKRNDGVIASGVGFTMENFRVINYKGNGVTTQGADDVVLRRLIVESTGIYGIYPTRGNHILVEDTVTSGIADAGIYIGMCTHVEVRRNEIFNNVAGIEVENSSHVLVEENNAHDNAGGILVFTLPGLPAKHGEDTIVRKNIIQNNNHVNFGAPASIVGTLPRGSGMIILAGDHTVVEKNIIRGNETGGIILANMEYIFSATTPDPAVNPRYENHQILDNLFFNNGKNPDTKVKILLAALHFTLSGADVIAHGEGRKNCISGGMGAKTVGLNAFTKCKDTDTTVAITTMFDQTSDANAKSGGIATKASSVGVRLATARALSHNIPADRMGEHVYNVVCAGCHASQGVHLIGPAVEEIQKKYQGNARGIAEFAFAPSKIRSQFPEMPSQSYLGKEKLVAAGEYILRLKR